MSMDLFTYLFALQWLHITVTITSLLTICCALIIVPQYWQQQVHAARYRELKPGIRVWTTQGIQGTIYRIDRNFIILEQDDGRKIEIIAQTIIKHDHDT